MKNTWARLNSQWKRFREQVKQRWNEPIGSKSPNSVYSKEGTMNIKWNHIAGQWTRFHGKARERWDALTERDLNEINGRFDVLSKKLQEKYSIDKEEAKQQIDMWTASLSI